MNTLTSTRALHYPQTGLTSQDALQVRRPSALNRITASRAVAYEMHDVQTGGRADCRHTHDLRHTYAALAQLAARAEPSELAFLGGPGWYRTSDLPRVRWFGTQGNSIRTCQGAADRSNWTPQSTCSEGLAGYWPDGFACRSHATGACDRVFVGRQSANSNESPARSHDFLRHPSRQGTLGVGVIRPAELTCASCRRYTASARRGPPCDATQRQPGSPTSALHGSDNGAVSGASQHYIPWLDLRK
jgi:hypothetical protein